MIDAYLNALLIYLRASLHKELAPTIKTYGGDPDGSQLNTPTDLPAILVTVRGSWPSFGGVHVSGKKVRRMRMVALIVVKDADGGRRLSCAAELGETIAQLLLEWQPNNSALHCTIYPLTYGPICENLYDLSRDTLEQTIWRVEWMQDLELQPSVSTQQDWVSVDIATTAHVAPIGVSPLQPTDQVISIAEDVKFSST